LHLQSPLTLLFESDPSSVSQNTQLFEFYNCMPGRDDLLLMHCCLHIINSTESPQLARQSRFVCVALQSFLSTISPHVCPSVLQASPRAHTGTHHHAESASHQMVFSRSNGTCVRKDVWAPSGLTGSSPLISMSHPLRQQNDLTSRVITATQTLLLPCTALAADYPDMIVSSPKSRHGNLQYSYDA
jgi:hypothetical protein